MNKIYPQVLFKNRRPDRIATFEEYRSGCGYQALAEVIDRRTPAELREIVLDAALLGRGGAAFPAGRKMMTIAEDAPHPRYVVCNADEMEPGTFKDRVLIHADPHLLIEGIILAAWSVQADRGIIFIRPEYENAARILEREIGIAGEHGCLGRNILGTGYAFDIVVHRSAGRYICGEVTAQINALMGKRANPRQPPPYLTQEGLWAKPTLVHNVETFACLPISSLGNQYWLFRGTDPNNAANEVRLPGVVYSGARNRINGAVIGVTLSDFTVFFDRIGKPYTAYTDETIKTALAAPWTITVSGRPITITPETGLIR